MDFETIELDIFVFPELEDFIWAFVFIANYFLLYNLIFDQ